MTDQPSRETDTNKPAKQPYGPGILLLLGIGLLALAAFCFKDVVYPASKAEEWRQEGAVFTIYLNWAVMIGGALTAVYAFVLAAKRAKGSGAGGTPSAPPRPEPPPAESEGRDEAGEPAMQAPTEGDEP